MFHLGMWRERMRDALKEIAEGRAQTSVPPGVDAVDSVNDEELASGIGTPRADAAARADHLLQEIAELYAAIGDRPLEWNESKTTTVGVLRNSYTHPRLHMYAYHVENGEPELGRKLFEDAVADMRSAGAPDMVMGIVLYNLATVHAKDRRTDEALALLREAIAHRTEARRMAAADEEFATLRDDPRFEELTRSGPRP